MLDFFTKQRVLKGCAVILNVAMLAAQPVLAQEKAANNARALAPSAKAPSTQNILDRVRRAGVLRVGVIEQVPWTFVNRDGNLAGFEVDVVRALAADLGVRLELVRASTWHIADDVNAGNFDIGAAGLWFSPQRALVVNFSNPYSLAQLRLYANKAAAAKRPTVEAFNRAEVKIGVRRDSPGANMAPKAFPAAQIALYDSHSALAEGVAAGNVDAALSMSPTPEYLAFAASDKIFLPTGDAIAARSESFISPRGDADILAYLNGWIRFRAETGWLKERHDYWFNGFSWADQIGSK